MTIENKNQPNSFSAENNLDEIFSDSISNDPKMTMQQFSIILKQRERILSIKHQQLKMIVRECFPSQPAKKNNFYDDIIGYCVMGFIQD